MKANRKNNKIFIGLILVSVLMSGIVGTLAATPLDSWNHELNPALLSTGNRPFFETGVSVSPGLQNSYFTSHKLSDPTLVIDFNDIYDTLGDRGYKVGGSVGVEAHNTAHLLGIGAGVYAETDTLFRVTIPNGLFEYLSEGIEMDTSYSDSGEALLQSFVEYGGYVGYRRSSFVYGLKIGKYAPLAYTRDGEGVYTYTSDMDGNITATAQVNAKLYSALDLEHTDELDDQVVMDALMGEYSGVKIDFGMVYRPEGEKKPVWGASISNIPLAAATPQYAWDFSATAEASINNALDTAIAEETYEVYNADEPVTDFNAIDSDENIYMPFKVGGFYRYDGLPIIDLIGHTEFLFGDPFRMNTGVTVEGASFPLSWLSLGIGYEDLAWRSSFGLRMNLRLLEISSQVSFSSPEFKRMFSSNGVFFKLMVGIGI